MIPTLSTACLEEGHAGCTIGSRCACLHHASPKSKVKRMRKALTGLERANRLAGRLQRRMKKGSGSWDEVFCS